MLEVRLDHPVPPEHQPEILKNLYWIDTGIEAFEFDPADSRRLRCRTSGATPPGLGDRVRTSAERLAGSLRAIPVKTAFELNHPVAGCANPYDALVERGWVRPALAGTHAYSGLFCELIHALDWQFRREALRLGADEHKFPSLLPLATLETAGYLASFPHNANFVCHLPEHADAINAFKARLGGPDGDAALAAAAAAQPGDAALSPTVCYHFFQSQAGRTLPPGGLLTATAVSPCYRFEGRAMRGLRRLREFNMREIVFLGSPALVRERKDLLLEVQRRMLERSGLRSVVRTASDPFFLDDYDKKRLFQISFDLKYEVQAWLPSEDEWLAIGSVNHHQDHFGTAFNIRLSSGEPAHSCCLGFGLDRWALAVFAQHDLDPARWPEPLRAILARHREVTRALREEAA